MSYHGDLRLGDTIDVKFTTVSTTGAPTTLAGTPVISAYVGNSLTQITAGITLTVDFDAVTGLHNVRVVATGGNGYVTASNYQLVITTGTVGGTSVVGYVIGEFSIEARSALMPTTATRTLDVSATGEAGIDWANVGTPGSTVGLSATTIGTLTTYTGNTVQTGDAFARLGAPAGASVSADILVIDNLVDDLETRLGTPTNLGGGATISANLVNIEGQTNDIGVAGAGLTNIGTIATVTTLTNLPAITAGWLTATGIAADAITAAKIATGAIDADAIATDAVTEIRSIVSGTSDSGTTTTMVDAARTEGDNDYWKDMAILFTSGTISGQARLITAFTAATDTITFSPATTQAVGTQTYEIIANVAAAGASAPSATDVANAVWDTDATTHQTQGTFGQAIGDPVADTNTIFKATVTDATGATVGVDVVDLKTQIGTAGAGLTNIDLPNQTMDITGNITGNLSGSVGSVTGAVGSVTGNVGGSTASVTAAVTVGTINANVITAASIAADAITDAKVAADVTIASVTGAVGSVTGAVGSVTGAVGSVTGNVGGNVVGSIGSIAAAGIAAASFAAAALNAIADAELDRNMATGTDSGTDTTAVRTPRQALRVLRNKTGIAAGTATITKEDDLTTSWTAAITTTAGNPISEVNPT